MDHEKKKNSFSLIYSESEMAKWCYERKELFQIITLYTSAMRDIIMMCIIRKIGPTNDVYEIKSYSMWFMIDFEFINFIWTFTKFSFNDFLLLSE